MSSIQDKFYALRQILISCAGYFAHIVWILLFIAAYIFKKIPLEVFAIFSIIYWLTIVVKELIFPLVKLVFSQSQKIHSDKSNLKNPVFSIEEFTNNKNTEVINNKDFNFDPEQQTQEQSKPPTSPEQMYQLLGVDPLSIHIGNNLIGLADPTSGGKLIEQIGILRQTLTLNFGCILPPVRVCDARMIGPHECRILIRGNTISSCEIYPEKYMILKSHWDELFSSPPENALNGWEASLQEPAYWVQAECLEELILEDKWKKDPYLTATQVLVYHLSVTAIQNIDELLTKAEVRKILDQVRQTDPVLVDNIIPNILSVGDLRKVLINLIKEKVSIRDISYILEQLEDLEDGIKNTDLLSEKIRVRLARQICEQHARNNQLSVVCLSLRLEEQLESLIQEVGGEQILNLDSQELKHLVNVIKSVYRPGQTPVIVCSSNIRLALSRKLREEYFQIAVLANSEIKKEYQLEIIKTLDVSDLI